MMFDPLGRSGNFSHQLTERLAEVMKPEFYRFYGQKGSSRACITAVKTSSILLGYDIIAGTEESLNKSTWA